VARAHVLSAELNRTLIYTLRTENIRIGTLLGNQEIGAPLIDKRVGLTIQEANCHLESVFPYEAGDHAPVALQEFC